MISTRTRATALLIAALWAVSAVAVCAASRDASWIKKAVSANMLEARCGRLAQSRDSNRNWQNFGARMVRDHTKALAQLRDLAREKHVWVSRELAPADRQAYDMLDRLHGRAFDRAYSKFAVNSHVQANRLYTSEIDNGHDSNVRAVAAKQLPVVQNHLTMADKLTGKSMRNMTKGTGK